MEMTDRSSMLIRWMRTQRYLVFGLMLVGGVAWVSPVGSASAQSVAQSDDLPGQPGADEQTTIDRKADSDDLEAEVRRGLPDIPGYWPLERTLAKPVLGELNTLRFITTSDYPPFNYLDSAGILVGFNIDIAWGICSALKVRCTVRRVPWDRMAEELEAGKADAAIASHRISAKAREQFLFTDRYYDTPARFVVRKEDELANVTPALLRNRSIAVVKGSAHEAFVRTFFKGAIIKPFDTADQTGDALRTGEADMVFGDSISLVFWIQGLNSKRCCRFVGGTYTEPRFFGNGVGIAIKKDNHRLKKILDYGLDRVRRSGLYQRLFTRHFPQTLF